MEKIKVLCSFRNGDYGLQKGNVKISDYLEDFLKYILKIIYVFSIIYTIMLFYDLEKAGKV